MLTKMYILTFFIIIISTNSHSLSFLNDEEKLSIISDKSFAYFNYHDNQHQNYKIIYGENKNNYPAYAIYTKSLPENGWDTLAISSYQGEDELYSDDAKAFAMGYLEGALTSERIWNHYLNMKTYIYFENEGQMTENDKEFFNRNLDWTKSTALEKKDSDAYWLHAYTVIRQMEGIVEGYNSVVEDNKKLSYADFQIINASGDISEVKYWKKKGRPDFTNMSFLEISEFVDQNSRCTGLIKVASDFSDVWFGHATWYTYTSTNRIFKEYRFKSNQKSEKSLTVAFSSYPGAVSSTDDFYITSQDLYVTETTIQTFKTELFDILTPETVLTWVRTIVANRLSDNGKTWTEIYAKFNSGTYNNQFQILDLKLIDTEQRVINDNALWIIEQMPGATEAADVTSILRYGYWPSYNSPYFKNIRVNSGFEDELKVHPDLKDFIGYDTCARANIFRRDQFKVDSLEAFKILMRYNDYKNDVLSKKNPALAVASRKDLVEESPECRGATDAKVTSIKDIKGKSKKKIYIISGPTNERQDAFDHSTAVCAAKNKYVFNGLPQKFNYTWVEYYTTLFE